MRNSVEKYTINFSTVIGEAVIDVKHKLVFKFPKNQTAKLLGILEIGLLVFYNLIGLIRLF